MDEHSLDLEIATTIFKIKMTKMKLMGTNDFTYLSTQMQEQAKRQWDLRQSRLINKCKKSDDKLNRNKQLDKKIEIILSRIKKLKRIQLELTYPNRPKSEINSWAVSENHIKQATPAKQTKRKMSTKEELKKDEG